MTEITQSRITEINSLYDSLQGYMKLSVNTVIKIGGLLVKQKKELGYGNFSQWITGNCKFSHRTALDYMGVFKNRVGLKTAKVANLTEARTFIKEKRQEDTRQWNTQAKINVETRETGKKIKNTPTYTKTYLTDHKIYMSKVKMAVAYARKGLFSPESIHIVKTRHDELRMLLLELEQAIETV